MFHTNFTVGFSFAGISDTVSDVSMAMTVTVCERMKGTGAGVPQMSVMGRC